LFTRTAYAVACLLALLSHSLPAASEIPIRPPELLGLWGDQANGTFVNPILPADFSDIDAIRVGGDFYAISSTFQYSPGVVILHSRDLVNWAIIGHAVSDITQIGPELNWDRMNRYGRGVWAGAIRYHDKKFWIYFGTPDEGFFMTTAADPAGPWSPLQQVWKVKGWDDGCPFWDDDGQGYLVCSNTAGGYAIHLFKLSPDGKSLLIASDKIIHQSHGSEANKLYKINGLYYHYYSQVQPEGRVIMMERSASLQGPWEIRQLNHVSKRIDKEPNQGGLVELASGDWWFLTHQGTGDWEGRAMALLPVTWRDGWPIIGKPGADGIGNMIWSAPLPLPSSPVSSPEKSDFAAGVLGPQWEWNYQPRAGKWSLTERRGFLRLHAPVQTRPPCNWTSAAWPTVRRPAFATWPKIMPPWKFPRPAARARSPSAGPPNPRPARKSPAGPSGSAAIGTSRAKANSPTASTALSTSRSARNIN
jgi:beta-xylosidase